MMLADSHIHKFLTGKQVVVIATIQAGGEPLAMPNEVLHDLATLIMISDLLLLEGQHNSRIADFYDVPVRIGEVRVRNARRVLASG